MDSQTLPLVPFGKYKGQPITTLLKDTEYLEWCKQQEFFKKYPIVYNICVNQTITTNNQSSKTPEHNKLQNMFLKKSFNIEFINKILRLDKCIQLFNELYDTEEYKLYFGEQKFNHKDYGLEKTYIKPIFETIFNWDSILYVGIDDKGKIPFWGESKIKLNSRYFDKRKIIYNNLFKNHRNIGYTYGSDDVSYDFPSICTSLYIEIKPLMGDDYPNVLRKMSSQIKLTNDDEGKFILLIGEYASQHTTKEEIIEIFKLSKIRVVFINEILDNSECKTIEKIIQSVNSSIDNKDNMLKLEEENRLLKEKILQLEEEIKLLKCQKNTEPKDIRNFFKNN
jgi:uncharacterized protein (DUF3820 family)